jgi:hypothetical protein
VWRVPVVTAVRVVLAARVHRALITVGMKQLPAGLEVPAVPAEPVVRRAARAPGRAPRPLVCKVLAVPAAGVVPVVRAARVRRGRWPVAGVMPERPVARVVPVVMVVPAAL